MANVFRSKHLPRRVYWCRHALSLANKILHAALERGDYRFILPVADHLAPIVEEGESQDTVDGVHVRVLARQVRQRVAWALQALPNTQGDVLVPDLRMLGTRHPHVLTHTHTRAHATT